MPSVREKFKLELKSRFSVLSTQNEDTDIEESWNAIQNVYIETHNQIDHILIDRRRHSSILDV